MRFLFPYMARWQSANWSRYRQLLSALCRRGHEVYVLQPPPLELSETNYTDIQIATNNGPKVQEVAIPPGLWNQRVPMEKLVKKGLYTLWSRGSVREIIREHDIDVLLVYNLPQLALARDAPCMRVFDIADDLPAMLECEVGKTFGQLARRVARVWQDRMMAACDLVTTSSATLQEQVIPSATLIPNGVCMDEIAAVNGNGLHSQYGGPIVGYLGAFEYFMNMDLVIEIARRLPDATFLLVGGGRDLERVRERVRAEGLGNVVLPGPVAHPAGLNYISGMDLCLIPFKPGPVSDSACPLKLFEYAALRKPIVSTTTAELQRIAGDYILFADTADEFAGVIREILNAPHTYQQLQHRGFDRVREGYSWDVIAERFLSAIELGAKSPKRAMTNASRQRRQARRDGVGAE